MAGLSSRPYMAPMSEFATPGDMQRERLSAAFGWDVGRPGMELLKRLFLSPQSQLGLGMRSPMGAQVGSNSAWAARTPSAVTGGMPPGGMWFGSFDHFPPAANSSVGLSRRIEASPPGGFMRDITPHEMGFSGPSAPANMNRAGSIGWAPIDSLKGPY